MFLSRLQEACVFLEYAAIRDDQNSLPPGELLRLGRGDAFLGALSGQALIRVDLDGTDATRGDEWDMGHRVREVEQAPDGSIWLLTDEGQVLRLTPP